LCGKPILRQKNLNKRVIVFLMFYNLNSYFILIYPWTDYTTCQCQTEHYIAIYMPFEVWHAGQNLHLCEISQACYFKKKLWTQWWNEVQGSTKIIENISWHTTKTGMNNVSLQRKLNIIRQKTEISVKGWNDWYSYHPPNILQLFGSESILAPMPLQMSFPACCIPSFRIWKWI
jgi:hypothetical protein